MTRHNKKLPMSQKTAIPSRLCRTPKDIVRDQRGETITEVLVAMVIVGLALLMLAVVIATSTNIVRDSREDMQNYYNTANQLVSYSAATTQSGNVTLSVPIAVNAAGSPTSTVAVTAYVGGDNANKPVVSYEEGSP